MSTITRNKLVNEFSKGGINVNDMTAENKQKLKEAGLSQATLEKIAGKDGRISGAKEFKKLFKAVDKFDHNGSRNSFATHNKDGEQTKSGLIHEALKSEVDRNRAKAREQGVIHLGMRESSQKEAKALEKGNSKAHGGVHRIEAWKTEGEIKYNGKMYDLKTNSGLTAFQKALTTGPEKMPKEQAQKFVDFLKTQDEASRDELSQLGLKFFQAGEGKAKINRLVISGHGFDGEIGGDGQGSFKLTDIEALAKVFPKGANKIEHVAVSACFCAGKTHFETLRSAFPNLKSAFAYNAYSPTAEKKAPDHLRKWESKTDGDDPSLVDPMFKKTSTWNVKDGIQGLPKVTLPDAIKSAEELEYAYHAYALGGKDKSLATKDPVLNEYYERLAVIVQHPDADAEEKARYEVVRKAVLKLRHPELNL
ncbi:MAG TPA: hypothetical protein VLH08_12520 [Acidobacteriota bacterium]|nr:hypothetical protein [Acidobacteriota bacterium]